ncbi:Rhs core protein with extension [Escherichia coli]|nr:Rhs core protein with extension [Escherichia coli]
MADISQQHLTEEKEKDHIHSIALALMVLRKYQLIILMVHDSHGEYWDEIFSGKDEKIVKSKDNNIKSFYLGTPSGNFKAIDNHGKEITNRKGLPNVCRVHGNM